METARYVVGVLLMVGLPPAVVWWYVVHPFVSFWRKVGVFGSMVSLGIMWVVMATPLVAYRDALLGRDLGTHYGLVAVAVLLAAPAIWIAIKRRRQLTVRILSGIPELEEGGHGGALLTEGLYAVIRHPRYVEVALGALAYAVFANYVGVYVLALATLPGLHLIVLLEERELAERFGAEYEAYRARVPRYWPRKGPAPAEGRAGS